MRETTAVLVLVAILGCFCGPARHAHAQDGKKVVATRVGASGLRLPRFVSLKSTRVNVRKGPSLDHPVAWEFNRIGLPVEVVDEFEHWRRIRDSSGSEGWVFHSLLSGRRTALVSPWTKEKSSIPLYARRSTSSVVVARLEPGVLGSLLTCDGSWCNFSLDTVSGWIKKVKLWGVYENEEIE